MADETYSDRRTLGTPAEEGKNGWLTNLMHKNLLSRNRTHRAVTRLPLGKLS